MTGNIIRKEQILTQEGKTYVMAEAEAEMLHCKLRNARDYQQSQKLGEGQGRVLLVQREHGPAYILILDFWPPELCGNQFLLF